MKKEYISTIIQEGSDILDSDGMQQEKNLTQHGGTTVYNHSLSVAMMSLYLADKMNIPVDKRSLVRGSLLHDYFLYDWHDTNDSHRLHGFTHAHRALENAERDFELNDTEKNMIGSHMFPLNLRLPNCRESIVLSMADKICAVMETVSGITNSLSSSEKDSANINN